MADKTLLISPLSEMSKVDSIYLAPDEYDTTGNWLYQSLKARTGATKTDYIRTFARVSLCFKEFNTTVARKFWMDHQDIITNNYDTVVLIGRECLDISGYTGILKPFNFTNQFVYIPDVMSGFYRMPLHKGAIEVFMEELYLRAIRR